MGVARPFFYEELHPEIAQAIEAALAVLSGLTAGTFDVQLPETADTPVLIAEAYAWHETLLAQHRALYHPRTVYWLEQGARVTMPQYTRARQKMLRLRREAARVFEKVDVVVTPTTPQPPITLQAGREPDLVLLRNAIPFNLLDLPTLSLPCGFTRDGLPIGLQLSGPRLGEARVLALGQAYEQATLWHLQSPAGRI